uniref:Uncharacterized protein n=1 Tax=Rhizophora mucronata TaxID=61149 RepID=A0A2P2IPM2_RHIMU
MGPDVCFRTRRTRFFLHP